MTLEDKINGERMVRYVITSAQYGASVNGSWLKTLEQYADVNDAEILVIPTTGADYRDDQLSPSLSGHRVIRGDYKLSPSMQIVDFQVRSNQIRPLTGLDDFVGKEGTTIVGSPKQHLRVVPNSNNDLPKVLVSTGSVTDPYYLDRHRVNKIAKRDHTFGALFVDTDENVTRSLLGTYRGVMYDLGVKYNGLSEPTRERPEALVLGDWHTGDTDPVAREKALELIAATNPKNIVFHDFFNGHSVNHHNAGKIDARHRDSVLGRSSLEEELSLGHKELTVLADAAPDSTLYLVDSNHHDFLRRYLSEGRFASDPENLAIGAELLLAQLKGQDPIEQGYKIAGGVPRNVKFLSRDDDLLVRGWQLASHGDVGANGSRGSERGFMKAYGKSIRGHSHSPSATRDTITIGTSTKLSLDYTRGASSWMHVHAFVYPNGKAQMVGL